MLFVISCVFALLGFFTSFFGITHENFIQHPKRVKRFKIATLIAFFIALVIAYFENHEVDKRNAKQYENIIRLTTIDSTSQAQIESLIKDSKIAQKEYVDSLINYHHYTTELLAKYGYRVDTLDNSIKKLSDKVVKETLPTLAILNKPRMYIKDTAGVYNVDLTFNLSALNANAHLTDAYYVIIPIIGDTLCDDVTVRQFVSLNYSEVVAFGGSGAQMYLPFGIPKHIEQFALVFNFDYKSKGQKQQTPLRKAYIVDMKESTLKVAQSFQFGMIGTFLKKKKIWPVIYNL